jgi:predicted helicase
LDQPRFIGASAMISPALIKPTHKAIVAYYEKLQGYGAHDVTHEMALRSAFQQLLEETGKPHKWTLIPEQTVKVGGKSVRPDGTFRDEWHLPVGYWEAKDTGDDLSAEIRAKIAKGYPLVNTIFEDTREAVLFQNGREAFRVPLTEPAKLADLLNAFYAHSKPDIESFKQAVAHFQERVPDLARALNERIVEAHKSNAKFKAAFADFFELCRQSLNPNLRREAVDEMLVQHLLTERLFRTVFDNPDFTRKNAIAVEIERVIDALASQSFSRAEFLRKLDHFYKAIEDAARGLDDWSDKQHFLNPVYERFFQGYSVKVADTHGIVYTPQEIVDFMCASVEEVLKSEFGLGLGDPGVHILDPCTGTGNFLVNLIRRIPKKDLPRMYREQLFANEVMLLPYYIAAMNIEHAYYERAGTYEAFEGLCFVDTLGLAEGEQGQLSFMTEKNTERVEHEKKAAINVIIGNPPYNFGQLNENDNNKNRKYEVVDQRVRETYSASSKATLKNSLFDPFVKFIRWATDRLGRRDGIVCFITNNAFIDNITFDGMRKHLLDEFDTIYHLDLRGNVRQNPNLSGSAYNVFGIQVGVGITVAVRTAQASEKRLLFHQLPLELRRQAKLGWLMEQGSIEQVSWSRLEPDAKNRWLVPREAGLFERFIPLGDRESKGSLSDSSPVIFKIYSCGVKQ